MLAALRQTGGGAVAVADGEIAHALGALAARGLFVEPTSATVLAGLDRLRAGGHVGDDDRCVLILTGSGLKASPQIADLLDLSAGAPGGC